MVKKIKNNDVYMLQVVGDRRLFAYMPVLGFGDTITLNRRGKQRKYPEYEFHIQCPFRIMKENQIILGSYDIYCALGDENDSDWETYGNNRFDKVAEDIIKPMLPMKVLDIFASEVGDIFIKLENETDINIFIHSEGNREFWRFIDFKNDIHVVFEERKINQDD